MIPAPVPRERGVARSVDGSRIAWYRYGGGARVILFIPTWNLVDARVVGHQVAALERHATVITYDPRGAGASDRPHRGYDFSLHAADALAVLDAAGIQDAALVTASRGINAAVLVAHQVPKRVARIAAVAPYMELDAVVPAPAMADHPWITDWAGFVIRFMHAVFTEPDSEQVIEEMIAIAMQASPQILITQEAELDWSAAPGLLATITCPTLLIHGDADATTPLTLVARIAGAMPRARLELIADGGHRPDIRSPDIVNPLLLSFLLPPDQT